MPPKRRRRNENSGNNPQPSTSSDPSAAGQPFEEVEVDFDENDLTEENQIFQRGSSSRANLFYFEPQNTRRFRDKWAEEKTFAINLRNRIPRQAQNNIFMNDYLDQLLNMFNEMLTDIRRNYSQNATARVYIDHPILERAIIVTPRRLKNLSGRQIIEHVEDVLSSAGEVPVDNDLRINIAVVRELDGAGVHRSGYYRLDFERDRLTKRCVVRVPFSDKVMEEDGKTVADQFCLPKAILIGEAYLNVENDIEADGISCSREKNRLRTRAQVLTRPQGENKLNQLTKSLMKRCKIPRDREGMLRDVPFYEEELKLSICVVSASLTDTIVYTGSDEYRFCGRRIYLYHWKPSSSNSWHFDVIRNMAAFMETASYCYECDTAVHHLESHSCSNFCPVCLSFGCEKIPHEEILCNDCHRTCRSLTCFISHKTRKNSKKRTKGKKVNEQEKKEELPSQCESRYKCPKCRVLHKDKNRSRNDHICGETYCPNCFQWFTNLSEKSPHLCHMRALSSLSLTPIDKFIFYDFECTQESGRHIPNLVVAHSACSQCEEEGDCLDGDMSKKYCGVCGTRCSNCDSWNGKKNKFEKPPCKNGLCGKREIVFRGEDVTHDFGRWLVDRQHRNCTVIAHNARGYDNYFILDYLLQNNISPAVIFNGTKAVYMRVGKGLNIRFLDSLMFLPMSLAQLPKCFDLKELKKGYFPHFFNKPLNYASIKQGLPPKKDYGYDRMTQEKQDEFNKWYEKHENDIFDFENEMLQYCRSDVDILRRACLKYRQLLMKETHVKGCGGIDPFCFVSAASVCMGVFRARFLPEIHEVLLKKDANSQCVHDTDNCSCKWRKAEMKHADADLVLLDKTQTLDKREIHSTRFVSSPIGLLPPTEYRPRDNYSSEAMLWLEEVEKSLNENLRGLLDEPISIQTAQSPEGEKTVKIPATENLPPATYKLDGFFNDPITGNRTALEFYGCHWHGCPRCFPSSERKTKIRCQQKTLDQRYHETVLREERLKALGFVVLSIWACEFRDILLQRGEVNTIDKRKNQNEKNHIYLRDAYFGGRTAALKMYHKFDQKMQEKGKYVDFTSLYPWALKYGTFPLSHPVRFSGKQVKKCFTKEGKLFVTRECDFLSRDNVSQEELDTRFCPPNRSFHKHHYLTVFGVVKLTILPPQNLLHPVLPYRCLSGKLVFPLCAYCAEVNEQEKECCCVPEKRSWVGTFCSGEIEVALDAGYQILKVHEILHWEQNSKNIFSDYVNTFLRIKQEASDYPSNVSTEQDIQRYIENYRDHEGILLNQQNIKKSSALRSLAKLMLNSIYGKFGQRTNLRKSHIIDNPQDLCELLTDPTKTLIDFHVLNSNMMQLETQDNTYFSDMDLKTNVVISAFTASWARVKLWVVMQHLGDRVLYTDTDSLVYISQPNKQDPPLGDFLGELTDEISCKNIGCKVSHAEEDSSPHFIEEFVAGGPKNYSYKLNSGQCVCKIRGFTLDVATAKMLNFQVLKRQILHWKNNRKKLQTMEKTKKRKRLGEEEEEEGGLDDEAEEEEEEVEDLPTSSKILIQSWQITRQKRNFSLINKSVSKRYGLVVDKNRVLNDLSSVPFGYQT